MKLDRIISIATLAALIVAIVLLVKKPAPVAPLPQAQVSQATSGNAAKVQSNDPQPSNLKADDPEPVARQALPTQAPAPLQSGSAYSASNISPKAPQPTQNSPATPSQKAETTAHSAEISAAVAQLLGGSGGAGLTPDTNVGDGAPNIKDQKVTYDGDTVHGQFLTEIAGKDVWITISGHMGQKDGYATFDPTEFKVGNMDVPVSLVNPMLQRKLAEERDRLKIAEPAR